MTKIKIPKFSIQHLLNLKPYLSEDINKGGENIKTLFENTCDLSEMTDTPIFVSSIFQSAKVEFDEFGTIASAGTASIMEYLSMKFEDNYFEATRPFLVYIFDKVNQIPLFSVHVSDPTKF